MITKKSINDLSYKIIGAAIEVHKELGPGLLESVYEKCLKRELELLGMEVKEQVTIPVTYKGIEMECEYRLDLLVENLIIIELKSVDALIPLFTTQLLTYMRLMKKPKGLLINFNSEKIIKNTVPLVNEYFANLPDV